FHGKPPFKLWAVVYRPALHAATLPIGAYKKAASEDAAFSSEEPELGLAGECHNAAVGNALADIGVAARLQPCDQLAGGRRQLQGVADCFPVADIGAVAVAGRSD